MNRRYFIRSCSLAVASAALGLGMLKKTVFKESGYTDTIYTKASDVGSADTWEYNILWHKQGETMQHRVQGTFDRCYNQLHSDDIIELARIPKGGIIDHTSLTSPSFSSKAPNYRDLKVEIGSV